MTCRLVDQNLDVDGDRRLNGEPFNANEISNSKETDYLALPRAF